MLLVPGEVGGGVLGQQGDHLWAQLSLSEAEQASSCTGNIPALIHRTGQQLLSSTLSVPAESLAWLQFGQGKNFKGSTLFHRVHRPHNHGGLGYIQLSIKH